MALGEVRMLGAGYDKYSLPTVTNAYQGSEKSDRIVKTDETGLPHRLVLYCENRDLKLQLEKTYYFTRREIAVRIADAIGGSECVKKLPELGAME